MFDNQRIDLTCESDDDLLLALRLALGHDGVGRYGTATGWLYDAVDVSAEWMGATTRRPRLVLTRYRAPLPDRFAPFPAPVDANLLAPIVRSWLAVVDYGDPPDHDGDNHKAWRVYNEAWGHVAPYNSEAFLAVEPRWAMYGK